MPITYTIDYDEHCVMEVWTGDVHVADLAAYWKQLLSDPEAREIRRSIADLRQAVIHVTGLDLNYLLESIVHPMLTGRPWKTAIVVGHPAHVGISRQYQVFAKAFSIDAIFHDLEEAKDWMHRDHSDEPG